MGKVTAILILGAVAFAAAAAFMLSGEGCRLLDEARRRSKVKTRWTVQGLASGLPDLGLLAEATKRLPWFGHLIGSLLRREEKDKRAIREQLPMALRSLSASLSIGQSNLQAFSYVADNTPDPLGGMLKQTVWDMEAGTPLASALNDLMKRTDLPEMQLLCVAFSLQQRSGGSMRSILEAAADSVRSSFEFERSIKVQTAQARLSAKIVGAVPFVLLGLLAMISPSYLTSFFASPGGMAVFVTAMALELVGMILIRRIIAVR